MSKDQNISIKRDVSDKRIIEYFKNRSKLNKILNSKDRSRLSKDEEKFAENLATKLRQDKKRLLDNVIFPSMNNLLVFFERLKENEELLDLFENDIKELFGYIREPQNIDQEDESEYNIRHNVIGRFLDSVLTWNIEKYPDNFRLGLIEQIQQVIFDKVTISMSGSIIDKERLTILSQTIDNDMRRALSWTQFLSSMKFDSKTKNIKKKE
jgi:hypothetical protein